MYGKPHHGVEVMSMEECLVGNQMLVVTSVEEVLSIVDLVESAVYSLGGSVV
jgi:hypothetical protein